MPRDAGGADTLPQLTASSTKGNSTAPSGDAESNDVASASPTNVLTLRLMHQLQLEAGNVCFSAASLRMALGMVALGAEGETLNQMVNTLVLEREPARNVAAAKDQALTWRQGAGSTVLSIANRVWVQKGYTLNSAFTHETSQGYGASAGLLDFKTAPEPSRKAVNRWALENTRGKVDNTLPEGAVTNRTRLVITNAIYFKGKWKQAFDPNATRPGAFATEYGAVSVPMMRKKLRIGYFEDTEIQAALLPYRDSALAMLIVLPRSSGGLKDVEAKMTAQQLDIWAAGTREQPVDITLPRFEFEWGRSLKNELEALGMHQAFGTDANFSRLAMPSEEPLYISDIFHKTFVRVDEVGTQAAAVTAGVMMATSLHIPRVLRVDHPFLFFIRHQSTGDLLFAGRVVNPEKSRSRDLAHG